MGLVFNLADGDNARIVGRTIGSYQDTNGNYEGVPVDNLRASLATEINKDGLIQEVGVDVLRFDYSENSNGDILTEPEATNKSLWSESANNAYWTKTRLNVSSNVVISPDGTQSADKIFADNTGSSSHILKGSNTTMTDGQDVCAEAFFNAAELDYIALGVTDVSVSNFGLKYFDIKNGIALANDTGGNGVVVDSYIKQVGDSDWYRVGVKSNLGAGITTSVFRIYLSKDGVTRSFNGDGVSGVYTWGREVKDEFSSYIKTEGSTETRAADTGITTGDISHLINSEEGVVEIRINKNIPTSTQEFSVKTSATNGLRFQFWSDGTARFFLFANGVQIFEMSKTLDYSIINTLRYKYKSGDSALFINGVEESTRNDLFVFTPELSVLNMDSLKGRTSYVKIYDSADDY